MSYPDCRNTTPEEDALIKKLQKYAKNCILYYEGKIFDIENWAGSLDNKMLLSGDYTGAFLSNAQMNNSNFSGAYFRYANLSGANLSHSSCTGASFVDADLTCTNFTSANLRGANFINANIGGAKLKFADLSQAIGIRTVSPFGYHGEPVYVVARSKGQKELFRTSDNKLIISRKITREPIVYGYDFRFGYREPYIQGKKTRYNHLNGYPLSAAINLLKVEYTKHLSFNRKTYQLDEWIEALQWAGKVAATVKW